MPQTINTNIASLNAQRNLNASQSSLQTSMQRLSSGVRVNSAKDDAAGLAIAERMNTQVRGLSVAARNANDGISMAQTAEGALGKIGDMLQRMRELAVQSSNASNSTQDRSALQAEVGQLRDEIDRVAKQTGFNGTKLLDGSFSAATFQVGANSGEVITVAALTNASATGLSKVVYGSTSQVGVSTSGITTLSAVTDGSLAVTVSGVAFSLANLATARTGEERLGQVVEAINRLTSDTGLTAFLKQSAPGVFDVELRSDKLDTSGAAVATSLTGFSTAITGISGAGISAGTATSTAGIDALTIATPEDAWLAMKQIDDALVQINGARATLGAVQSRFESAVSNIMTQGENTSAARGRIMDADFAAETANLSRAQILQQAGTAMVAQANQLPQQVLKLLQG
ncbi:flagellin [uncultured Aquincola sp.]|uniref:flagellin n=1 Tax=uncultured Aquincola sp. TaxID=886556 RepID=UPI0032B25D6E|tara:strand:- start:2827 stop:4026 length:1200 start_codon:yes stop_codon:yes gene_type:complete